MKLAQTFLFCLCFAPLAARAHALLVDSSPKNNSVLTQPPAQATLQFNARIEKNVSQASLITSSGNRIALSKLSSGAGRVNQLVLALPRLSSDAYRLEYRILASDGHVTPGYIQFRVAEARSQ